LTLPSGSIQEEMTFLAPLFLMLVMSGMEIQLLVRGTKSSKTMVTEVNGEHLNVMISITDCRFLNLGTLILFWRPRQLSPLFPV
jgi:hypothetical protein